MQFFENFRAGAFPQIDNCFISLDRICRRNKRCHSRRNLFGLSLYSTFNLRLQELRKNGESRRPAKVKCFLRYRPFWEGKTWASLGPFSLLKLMWGMNDGARALGGKLLWLVSTLASLCPSL